MPLKVNLFIIGATKAGTTSLHFLLQQHPQISMSAEKEPAHFLLEENFASMRSPFVKTWWNEDRYHSLFSPNKVMGESSTVYSQPPFSPGIAKRILEYNPEARIIYLVRDPVDRLVSHYNFDFNNGIVSAPLEKAIERHLRYIGASDYATQLQIYRDRFPADNLLVLISERFRPDKIGTLRRIESFLGLDPLEDPVAEELNVTPEALAPPRLPAWLYHHLNITKGWKSLRRALPKPARALGRRVLFRRPHAKATRADVPECIIELLAARAGVFRDLISDPIPEWDI